MPRGQKSKLHAQKKHKQARCEAQARRDAQDNAEETSEAVEEYSAATQIQPEPESSSTPKIPQKTTPSADSDESSSEESEQSKEREYPPEANLYTTILHQELLSRKVVELLQCLLHNYNLKQLTTKEEMLKVITKQLEKDFAEILRKASKKLEDTFAVEVREVNSSKPSYDLISKLKLPNNGRIRAGRGLPKTGFLMSILGIIFVRGNCVSEEAMWKILKNKQIYPGKKHPILGEPRKLLTQYLVKLKYLEYRQVANSNPPRYEFLWGSQAHDETSKMKVLDYLAKINKTTPGVIPVLYKEVMTEEQEQAEARDENNSEATDQASEDFPVKLPAGSTIPIGI